MSYPPTAPYLPLIYTVTTLILVPICTPFAQQIPAPVTRGLEGSVESTAPSQPIGAEDFFATGHPSGIMGNVEPILGAYPNSPTLISASQPFVNPNIPPVYVAPPPPPPPAAIRPLGPGRYMILPAESPLLTAPLATLNPAGMIEETETALPLTEETIPSNNLATAPLQQPTMPAPEAAENITQADIANRLASMADRLETMTAKAEEMEQRADKIEQKSAAKPASILANLPYVNDAIAPGPKAKAAIKKLAEQLKAAPPAFSEGNWSVTALVDAPPIGTPASAIAQSRLQAVLSELRTQGVTLPKAPPAMVVVRSGGTQYLKLAVRPE